MRPHVITLGYTEIKRARRFYEKGLGFKASPASQGDVVFYATGGVVLALYPRTLLAQDATLSSKGSGFEGVSLGHNVERRSQVARLLAKAAKAGGKVVKAAQDTFWGGHSGYFRDPDGHLWEVAWAPMFKFDRNGNLKV